MRFVRTALLGATVLALPLALAAAASAAPPPAGGMVLYDAAGTPVAILTPLAGAAQVADDPALRMLREMEAATAVPFDGGLQRFIAAQEASMRALEAEMQTMVPNIYRGPGQSIEVAIPPAGTGQVSGSYVWSVASGQGHCAESVTFTYSSDGSAPQIAQRKTGKVCGKWDNGKTGSMPAAATPEPPADGVKLMRISTPPRPRATLHG